MKVPGRKTIVNTEMVFIAELSLLLAMAIDFMVALSREPDLARLFDVRTIWRFS
jgi:hypothetical protein